MPPDYGEGEAGCVAMWAWTHPLVHRYAYQDGARQFVVETPVCMVASKLLREAGGHAYLAEGYVHVVLGMVRSQQAEGSSKASWQPCIERAHRLVLWALLGPLDLNEQDWGGGKRPLVMHQCNNSRCLHPGCLLLGNYSENNRKRGHGHYADAVERRKAKAIAVNNGA